MQNDATVIAGRGRGLRRAEIIELALRCGPVGRFELLELADWVDVVAHGCGRLERVPAKWRGLVAKLVANV